jgi:short-subunit dehydrogenase
MRIEGSNIVVTGASSGIGAALAPMLAERGATVGLVARRADRLEEVVAECRRHTPGSRAWPVDLGDLAAADAFVHQAAREFDPVDCLVNNAAIPARIPVSRLTPADIAHVMDVNFHAPVRMSLALLPDWLARGAGCVVNVSSLGGRVPIGNEAAYCASKFALCGWTETMAVDLHGSGVEVKLVLPGPIDTEIWDQPGNDPADYQGPFVPAAEAAASIVEAIEGSGFEYYAPPDFPGGGPQHDIVVGKSNDPGAFVAAMGSLRA